MKEGLLSRLFAAVVVAFLLAWSMVGYAGNKLSWLASTSADQVVAHDRLIYSHGYLFQAFSFTILAIPILLVVEILAAIIRRYVIDA